MRINILLLFVGFFAFSPPLHAQTNDYDLIIKSGTVYDGTGESPSQLDIGVNGDRIDTLGTLDEASADTTINAEGLAIAPGFINMLSWAAHPLLQDGRSMSNITQGVTLEVFGEGSSLGPINPENIDEEEPDWVSFGEALEHMENKGVSPNVASFVGATTIRRHQLEGANRDPSPEELHNMQELVRESMRQGALGVGSSLIYAPAFFADTEELIALSEAAAEYNGIYISHLRSEGDNFLEAVDEFVEIATKAEIDAEIYHLKAAGEHNWPKLDTVITRIDSLREAGHNVSANMYPYTAASTGLDATVPPWVQEGSTDDFMKRLKDDAIREKVLEDMNGSSDDWENFLKLANDPENILLLDFDADSLSHFTGKTLADVVEEWDTTPAEAVLDLLIKNGGDIGSVYFLMSEDNVRKKIQLPYMTFGSDARSVAAEGSVLESSTHPRTYGTFARILGKYVRDEQVISLEEAIHRLTWMTAKRIKIEDRGLLSPGYFADIVIFDPNEIRDTATFTEPHQYAKGVQHVFVNGTQVLKDGDHTGATPGRFVRGPGYSKDTSN